MFGGVTGQGPRLLSWDAEGCQVCSTSHLFLALSLGQQTLTGHKAETLSRGRLRSLKSPRTSRQEPRQLLLERGASYMMVHEDQMPRQVGGQ